MSGGPLVIVGDTLLDVDVHGRARDDAVESAAPVLDTEDGVRRPGGAGLAALLAAAEQFPVRLVTALGRDEEAGWLADVLGSRMELVAGPALGGSSTKTRVLDRGRPILRLDRGDGAAAGSTPRMREALADAGAVLVADYGRGVAHDPALRHVLAALAEDVQVVWDPHPRGATPVPGCAMVTPNLAEARRILRPREFPEAAVPAALLAAPLVGRDCRARCAVVTVGAEGAVLARPGRPAQPLAARPAPAGADACGAGDRFAGALAVALLAGMDPVAAATRAVHRASRFVAEGGAAGVRLPRSPATERSSA